LCSWKAELFWNLNFLFKPVFVSWIRQDWEENSCKKIACTSKKSLYEHLMPDFRDKWNTYLVLIQNVKQEHKTKHQLEGEK